MTRPGAPRWYDAIDPVTAILECGSRQHFISWRRGRLVLHDHDLTAEVAAMALGGEPPPCVQVLVGWRNRNAWDNATRGRSPGFAPDPSRPLVPRDLISARELGVIRRWDRRWARQLGPRDEGDIYGYLRRRALAPFLDTVNAAARRRQAGGVEELSVRVAQPGDPASISGWMDSQGVRAIVLLPTSWLWRVCARGLAQAGDAFVLDVTDDRSWPLAAGVDVVVWEEASGSPGKAAVPVVRPATAIFGEPGWSLAVP